MPKINTSLDADMKKEMQEAFQDHAKAEIPILRNYPKVIAEDYFKYGWEAAIRLYSIKEPQNDTLRNTR